MTEKKPDRVDRLIQMALELNEGMEELAQDAGKKYTTLAVASRRNRAMIWGLLAGGVMVAVLAVVLAFSVVGLRSNTDRIDAITTRLDTTNTEQRRRALCPLYQVFLDSESEQGRKAAPDPEKYDHAFDVIRKGYDVLECASFEGNYDDEPGSG